MTPPWVSPAEALDRLQPTAASHARVMVLEVMGRDAGHIALAAGIAGGADVILIPEIPFSMDSVLAEEKIHQVRKQGRNLPWWSCPRRSGHRKVRLQKEFWGGEDG